MADQVAFLYCVFEVNLESSAWRKVIQGVVAGMDGLPSCDVGGDGKVVVTGRGKPQLVLKTIGKAGKEAKLRDMRSGQCSTILDLRYSSSSSSYYPNNNNYYYNPNKGYPQNYYHNPNRPFYLGFPQSRTFITTASHPHSHQDQPNKWCKLKKWCCFM